MRPFHIDGTTQLNIYEAKSLRYQAVPAHHTHSAVSWIHVYSKFINFGLMWVGGEKTQNAFIFFVRILLDTSACHQIIIKQFFVSGFFFTICTLSHYNSTDKRVREWIVKMKMRTNFWCGRHGPHQTHMAHKLQKTTTISIVEDATRTRKKKKCVGKWLPKLTWVYMISPRFHFTIPLYLFFAWFSFTFAEINVIALVASSSSDAENPKWTTSLSYGSVKVLSPSLRTRKNLFHIFNLVAADTSTKFT